MDLPVNYRPLVIKIDEKQFSELMKVVYYYLNILEKRYGKFN